MKGQKTGGRATGTPNKVTQEVRELARQHGPDAIAELARLAREAESEQARVAAIRELLDRAYGKSPMSFSDEDGEATAAIVIRTVYESR